MSEVLATGEQVIWRGRPKGLRGFLRSFDVFLLFFAGLAVLFFVTALTSSNRVKPADSGDYQIAVLFPVVVFGLFFFAPRLLSVWREASGTEYLLTNKRVVINGRRRRLEFDLRSLPYLELERSWVSGPTIFFAQRNMYEGWGMWGGSSAPAFRGLRDTEDVYEAITRARAMALTR